MARKRRTSPGPKKPAAAAAPRGGMTAERILRLYRLLSLLGTPRKRETLTLRLKIDVRGFYRDLDSLRALGVEVMQEEGRYRLAETVDTALSRLPFPDPRS